MRPGRAELFPLFESVPVDDVIEEVDPIKLLSSTEQFPGLKNKNIQVFIVLSKRSITDQVTSLNFMLRNYIKRCLNAQRIVPSLRSNWKPYIFNVRIFV